MTTYSEMLRCALEVADQCWQLSDTLHALNWQDFGVLDLRESDEAHNLHSATQDDPCARTHHAGPP